MHTLTFVTCRSDLAYPNPLLYSRLAKSFMKNPLWEIIYLGGSFEYTSC